MEQIQNPTHNLYKRLEDRRQLAASEGLIFFQCYGCNREWNRKSKEGERATGDMNTTMCGDCAMKKREAVFATTCPSLYQKTDTSKLPQEQLKKAMDWKYGSRGLILLGDTGKGKSRVAWSLLKRLLVDDKPLPDSRTSQNFVWFDATSFGHEIIRSYRDETADLWLDKVCTCPLVFFDDLGKLKLTERAEVELFGVIERRCASELPIIVTTNDTGDSLAARMSDNRGPAMIRRLREFCEPIQF